MATKLEALGAASAVLQVIYFSCSVASLSCYIYDWKSTVENDIEDYATRMMDAADRVQTRCLAMPQTRSAERKLAEVGQKCHDTAEELRRATQRVTQLCRKGIVRQAIWATLTIRSWDSPSRNGQGLPCKLKELTQAT